MSSHLELLYCSWRSTSGFHRIILQYWKRKGIRIEKHLQCEKLLGLAGGNTKKHGNKKSGESRTPIRYNVMIHYHSWQSIVNCQVHPSTSFLTIIHGWTVYMPCIRTQHSDIILACTKYTFNEHYCPLNIPTTNVTGLTLENQIAWKTASLISRKCTYELRCNGLEFCSRRISCFHAFWCFPRPILAIFHIANVFLSGFQLCSLPLSRGCQLE